MVAFIITGVRSFFFTHRSYVMNYYACFDYQIEFSIRQSVCVCPRIIMYILILSSPLRLSQQKQQLFFIYLENIKVLMLMVLVIPQWHNFLCYKHRFNLLNAWIYRKTWKSDIWSISIWKSLEEKKHAHHFWWTEASDVEINEEIQHLIRNSRIPFRGIDRNAHCNKFHQNKLIRWYDWTYPQYQCCTDTINIQFMCINKYIQNENEYKKERERDYKQQPMLTHQVDITQSHPCDK